MLRLPLRAVPILAAACAVAATTDAGVLTPVADTWGQRNLMNPSSTPFDRTAESLLKTRDNGNNDAARNSIVRFDISGESSAESIGSTFVLELGGATSGSVGTISVYGVVANVAQTPQTPSELTFLDADAYTEQDMNASDASGNGLREAYGFDPDPVSNGVQPVGVATYDRSTDGNGTLYTFSGSFLDAYLTQQLSAGANSVAFVFSIQREDGNTADNRMEFTSSNGTGMAPTLTIVPEPASLVLLGVGALVVASRGRRLGIA